MTPHKELFFSRINLLSEEEISFLLDVVLMMSAKNALDVKPDYLHCVSSSVIRYGHKCNQQRFLCKACGRTFVMTTHTIMENSHFLTET